MFYPFLLTIVAGLSTLLGTIPLFIKIKNKDLIISAACSFASGVMISISILDLIPESINHLNNFNPIITIIICFIFLMIGIILAMLLDTYINKISQQSSLYKVGILSMIAIILHNIPEGIVTFIVSNKNILLGISLCIAISLHNIPEGISIAIPLYYSTKSKKRALLYTFISAISEPLGAVLAYLFIAKFITNTSLGMIFAFIAGIMIQISVNKLLPTGNKYNKSISYIFFVIGFLVMLLSLYLNSIV